MNISRATTAPLTFPAGIPTAPSADATNAEVTAPAGETVADSAEVRARSASDFDPVDAEFPTGEIEVSLDEPLTGVIKGEELEARFKALETEVDGQLEQAKSKHAELLSNLGTRGRFDNTDINNILRAQHAIDQLEEIKTLVQNRNANAVHKLQTFIQKSAIDADTGQGIGVDNAYGPDTEAKTLARIREPESTYVDRDFSPRPQGTFVYQGGEIGEHGTPMEAQGNCGPASIAMLVSRFGGEAPTMQQIRKNASAITGNRPGTYGLDGGQLERGLKNTLADQGITVETHTESYGSKETDQLIEDMRQGLAEGKQMILLTSNLETGSQGHYVVVTEVKPNGNIVVQDPQSENGQNREYTPEELKQGIKTRRRFSRLMTAWKAPSGL